MKNLDEQTRAALARAGADLQKPTNVLNYLYLPDEARANAAGQELRSAGYDVTVRPASAGPGWLTLSESELIPDETNIGALRKLFEDLADRYDGEYDGWEAVVTE
jgi:Regulator of ribonuclease activity B